MRSAASLATALACTAALFACASGEKAVRQVLQTTPAARKVLPEFNRYAKLARVFKSYHDKGHLDEDVVLDVLRQAGVFGGKETGGKKSPKPKPYPVPSYKGAYRWPLEAGVVSSEFGKRWGKNHHGMDIAADAKEPVYAAAEGTVLYSGNQLTGYGNVVILRHDSRTTTLYAHNTANRVKTGDKVARDQVIALLGSTGRSTGPHVHFEMRDADRPIDPRSRLPQDPY